MTGDDQDKRTRRARLLAASPEYVFEELGRYGAALTNDPFRGDKELEKLLLVRQAPLIDLGLAMHASEKEVVAELYRRGRRAATDDRDAEYLNGLRVACLSNRVVNHYSFSDFPQSLIGEEETRRVLATAEWEEAEALLRNPTVGSLLTALYKKTGLFAELPEDRWLKLLRMSVGNTRLISREDTDSGPDLEHMRLHEAAFGLLELAPVEQSSLTILHTLYDYFDPEQIWSPPSVAPAIERWRNCEVSDYKGNPSDGYYTGLDLRDEFLCLVASLYDRPSYETGSAFRDVKSSDPIRRAAHYAKAKLTPQDMDAAMAKDKEFFVYAAFFNDHVLMTPALRLKYEDGCLLGDLRHRYKIRCEQLHRRWRSFDPKPVADWLREENEEATGAPDNAAAFAALQKSFSALEQQVSRIWFVAIACLCVLGVLLWKAH